MCSLEWLGRLRCRATGLDASLSSFSTSRRCSRNRSPNRLPVSPMYSFLHNVMHNAGYAIDNICRGTRETISDLNRSLRARYFVSVVNERTSFASRARAFEGTRLLNYFECASD